MSASTSEIQAAAKFIQEGKLVAMPTETVYGLGAHALDPQAVARIFASKERPSFDPLIVHVCDQEMIQGLIGDLTPLTQSAYEALAQAFWPGPMTLILPKSERVPDIVSSGLPTVGIRMPNHPVALELIRQSGCPIAAPSANKFGRTSPTTPEHVTKQLDMVEAVLDGGPSEVGIESTIIALTPSGFEILRPGAITPKMVSEALHHAMHESGLEYPEVHNNHAHQVEAPGMLDSHYSPTKPLHLVNAQEMGLILEFLEATAQDPSIKSDPSTGLDLSSLPKNLVLHLQECLESHQKSSGKAPIGLINFDMEATWVEGHLAQVLHLSPKQQLSEYAVGIFGAIHHFEDSSIQLILAQKVPQEGIGVAIMDRLQKAAFQYQ